MVGSTRTGALVLVCSLGYVFNSVLADSALYLANIAPTFGGSCAPRVQPYRAVYATEPANLETLHDVIDLAFPTGTSCPRVSPCYCTSIPVIPTAQPTRDIMTHHTTTERFKSPSVRQCSICCTDASNKGALSICRLRVWLAGTSVHQPLYDG
ncbi:hypothetical protein CBL_12645 [Carabus blaptoides fortunei]